MGLPRSKTLWRNGALWTFVLWVMHFYHIDHITPLYLFIHLDWFSCHYTHMKGSGEIICVNVFVFVFVFCFNYGQKRSNLKSQVYFSSTGVKIEIGPIFFKMISKCSCCENINKKNSLLYLLCIVSW